MSEKNLKIVISVVIVCFIYFIIIFVYTLSNQVDDGASSEYFSIFYVSLNGELLTIYSDKNKDADNYELPFYSVILK